MAGALMGGRLMAGELSRLDRGGADRSSTRHETRGIREKAAAIHAAERVALLMRRQVNIRHIRANGQTKRRLRAIRDCHYRDPLHGPVDRPAHIEDCQHALQTLES
jgi:hypothetical protein